MMRKDTAKMDDRPPYHGSLVALEGPLDVVNLQLRLLPACPQLMVLPEIQRFMPSSGESEEPVDMRTYIYEVHKAASIRHEIALRFLSRATPERKRIVFLPGGTAHARALCISTIRDQTKHKDISGAKFLFESLIKGGVSALMGVNSTLNEGEPQSTKQGESNRNQTENEPRCDKINRAHESSEKSDPSRGVMETTEAPYTGTFGSWQPESTKSTKEDESEVLSTSLPPTAPSSTGDRLSSPRFTNTEQNTDPVRPLNTHQADISSRRRAARTLSHFPSPNTDHSDRVIFGEARVVKMQFTDALKSSARERRVEVLGRGVKLINGPNSVSGTDSKRSRCGPAERGSPPDLPFPKLRPVEVRKAALAWGQQPSKADEPSTAKRPRATYVDKGTETEGQAIDEGLSDAPTNPDLPFQPVLPVIEDLIIRFVGDQPDTLLDSLVSEVRDTLSLEETFGEAANQVGLSIPKSSAHVQDGPREQPVAPIQTSSAGTRKAQTEYDPFAAYDEYRYKNSSQHERSDIRSHPTGPLPSVPQVPRLQHSSRHFYRPAAQSTTLPVLPLENFYSLSVSSSLPAVTLQNSLRAVLGVYFPADDAGYGVPYFPLFTERFGIWEPVFQAPEGGGNVDLVLAIGAQNGVSRDFVSKLLSRLEKIATKTTGESRAGRLELRYLIVKALQAFWGEELIYSGRCDLGDDPTTNDALLAALLIPQLETYLAAHTNTRFLLLEYPAECLPTILALQRYVGSDTLQVVGIINGGDIDPAEPLTKDGTFLGGANGRSPISRTLQSSSNHSPNFASRNAIPSFAKANFVLTSSATQSEIVAFTSAIWKQLIKFSNFYIPEHSPRKAMARSGMPWYPATSHPDIASSYTQASYAADTGHRSKQARSGSSSNGWSAGSRPSSGLTGSMPENDTTANEYRDLYRYSPRKWAPPVRTDDYRAAYGVRNVGNLSDVEKNTDYKPERLASSNSYAVRSADDYWNEKSAYLSHSQTSQPATTEYSAGQNGCGTGSNEYAAGSAEYPLGSESQSNSSSFAMRPSQAHRCSSTRRDGHNANLDGYHVGVNNGHAGVDDYHGRTGDYPNGPDTYDPRLYNPHTGGGDQQAAYTTKALPDLPVPSPPLQIPAHQLSSVESLSACGGARTAVVDTMRSVRAGAAKMIQTPRTTTARAAALLRNNRLPVCRWRGGTHGSRGEEEEEEEYDNDVRRLVPMLARRDEDKGGSRKALKFLGLID
ncbi:hypothetical protein VTK73DRAFT_2005 [Phialemonium thermophilum]|uniref:Uncharacterized protein n=1 Tax=Phialemonium thermophilum TaxID=223376 RepID=A0ABR3X6K9_9PEZI